MFKQFLAHFCLILGLLAVHLSASAGTITAARVWPAQDYTRIAFESDAPIKHQLIILKNPDRLVLDIENVELTNIIKSLPDRILSSDPYIKLIRTAKYKTNVVRIAIDLKGEVKSNIFALPPAGDYKHRLVIDIYPMQDELMAMLGKKNNENSDENITTKPEVEALPPYIDASDEPVSDLPAPSNPKSESKPDNTKPLGAKAGETKSSDSKPIDSKAIDSKPSKKDDPNKNDERIITIALDAGHGGEDPGARGASGTREKDVTLAIAKKLKIQIDAEPNMKAVLTRDGDFFIPLHGRVVKARNQQADLFVSIHADAFTNQAARGSSVFALSEKGATSASARYLAKKENESDLIGGVSLDDKDPVLAKTLLDLSQAATINDSLKLARAVLNQVGQVNELHRNKVEQAGFAVLKSPDIPSILVETAFISNPSEERKLNDEAYQDKLAESILAGIKKYFSSNPALAKTKIAKD
jgi:N-acetylmuramoyl-L-alanine amidase